MSAAALAATILGALVAAAGGVWVALIQRRTPYEALATRVGPLEAQVDVLRQELWEERRARYSLQSDLDMLIGALARQQAWQQTGAHPPPPIIRPDEAAILARHRAERANLPDPPPPPPEEGS